VRRGGVWREAWNKWFLSITIANQSGIEFEMLQL
jgi:hypothetical protein